MGARGWRGMRREVSGRQRRRFAWEGRVWEFHIWHFRRPCYFLGAHTHNALHFSHPFVPGCAELTQEIARCIMLFSVCTWRRRDRSGRILRYRLAKPSSHLAPNIAVLNRKTGELYGLCIWISQYPPLFSLCSSRRVLGGGRRAPPTRRDATGPRDAREDARERDLVLLLASFSVPHPSPLSLSPLPALLDC